MMNDSTPYPILSQMPDFNVFHTRKEEKYLDQPTPCFTNNSDFISPLEGPKSKENENPNAVILDHSKELEQESEKIITLLNEIQKSQTSEIQKLYEKATVLDQEWVQLDEEDIKLQNRLSEHSQDYYTSKFKFLKEKCKIKAYFWNICLLSPLETQDSSRRRHYFNELINQKEDLLELTHYLTLNNLKAERPRVHFVFNVISKSPRFSYYLIEYYLTNLIKKESKLIREITIKIKTSETVNSFMLKPNERNSFMVAQQDILCQFLQALETHTKGITRGQNPFFVKFKVLSQEKRQIEVIFMVQAIATLESSLDNLHRQSYEHIVKSSDLQGIEEERRSTNYGQLLKKNCCWINLVVEQELFTMEKSDQVLLHLKGLKNN